MNNGWVWATLGLEVILFADELEVLCERWRTVNSDNMVFVLYKDVPIF